MANTPLLISGAETGSFAMESITNGSNTSIVTTPVHSGARAFRSNPSTTNVGNIVFVLYSSSTGKQGAMGISATCYASIYFRPSTLPASANEIFAGFYTSTTDTTAICTFRISSGGIISVYDSTNTLVATGTTALVANGGPHNGYYRIDLSAN